MEQQNPLCTHISSVVCKTLTLDKIEPHIDLMDSGLLDSLSLVMLMVALEETFHVRIEPQELDFDDFRSVTTIANLIARLCVVPTSL
jgi:D-alanine--poly(phosphoribitol) ligase subunit 2